MNERSPKEKPRLVLIMGGRMEQQREEAKRRAEIREFIAACERLYEKNRAAFPRPANSVSHSSIRQPVTHIPTTPTTTEAQPILPVIQKEIF